MPQPEPDESKNDYLKRCIPELIHEGREQKQSIAICLSIYDRRDTQKNHKNHRKENMNKSDKTKLYMAHY